jgi:glutathione synthase/RimK-type ligase-like ATP-grasp enzyme
VSLSGYLVQPEINLIRLNGRICDVRVLVQRDADGEWHITGIGVRAGQAGSVVSNLHGGGKALRLEGVLQKTLGADSAKIERIKTEVEEIALRVGRVLAHATKCLGELGVDIGIDTQGRVWIIEANSRTGRATFRRAGMRDAAQLADRRPLLFAQYLAGFSS